MADTGTSHITVASLGSITTDTITAVLIGTTLDMAMDIPDTAFLDMVFLVRAVTQDTEKDSQAKATTPTANNPSTTNTTTSTKNQGENSRRDVRGLTPTVLARCSGRVVGVSPQ
ncbi:hypothetical protein SAMN05216244_3079 [Sediminibacillus halophilus]|uniref:Uncharacterized protein n=1 Tax=Sediminibacillus halophilus TaxID=482461 RepID=A0A1G9V0C3_9BACI|nr:hypothetical protein SAMN05216244_3079 [Sediminibacillus halophilus]